MDGDALTLTATLVDGSPLPDWLEFEGDAFTGTPPQDYNGALDIRVTASDGEYSTTQDFTLTIDPVNDAPILVSALDDAESAEDTAFTIDIPEGSFADVDGDALTITASLSDGSDLPAWLSFDGTSFTGTPPQDYNGSIDIMVTASDGELAVSDDFRLTITPVNDAPVAAIALVDRSSDEDSPISFTIPAGAFFDVDSAISSLTATQANGDTLPVWLTFTDGTFNGNPPQDFNGSLEISVIASDGEYEASQSFTLTIDPVNDAPILVTALADLSVEEDSAINIDLPAGSFADVDEDALTLIANMVDGSALPAWLQFADGNFSGTPPQDYNGSLDIRVTASDGDLIAYDVFRLSVTAVNDAPVVSLELADQSSPEDSAFDILLPADSFTDVDGDSLTLTAALADGNALPAWLNFDGERFTGTPPADFNGDIDIAVTASDGELEVSDTFRLSIDAINDAPVLVQLYADQTGLTNQPVSIAISTDNFSDVDGDALTLSATLSDGSALPAWLSFENGNLVGTPPSDGGWKL